MNFVCVCPVHALSRYWSSWTAAWITNCGPSLYGACEEMEHLTGKLLRVPIPQNSPRFAMSHFSWELQGSGFGESAVWWQRVVFLQNIPHFPAGVCSPSWGPCCCGSWASDCLHMRQGPREWAFWSITWHRAVSHCAGRHCTVHVCNFDDYALFLSRGFASLLAKYLARQGIFFFALQGSSPAPFL